MAASAWTPVSESAPVSGWTPVAESAQSQAAPAADPGTLHKVWNWANQGLISGKTLLNVVGDLTPGKPPDMKPGESTSDYLTRVQNEVDPNHPYWNALRVGLAGVDKDVASTISSFTSPLGIGTLAAGGAGEAAGVLGKTARAATAAASTGFAAQGVKNIAHAVNDTSGDLPTRVQEGLQGAASVAGGAAGATESAGPAARAVGENVTPKQAAQAAGAAAGLASGHGIWSTIEAGMGEHYAGKAVEGLLGKERANAPFLAKKPAPASATPEDFTEPGTSPQTESAATSEEQAPPETAAPAEAPKPDTSPAAIQQKLNDALGGKALQPNVPLKNQVPTKAAPTATSNGLPQGFTPVDSSALKGYKYDPAKQELTTISSNGQTYTHAEVTPEEAQAFQDADSKGKAWNTVRQNHVLVGKNGLPVKPVSRTIEVDPATGRPEFSDVIAAKQNGGQTPAATQAKPAPAASSAPTKAATNPAAEEEDLTNLLQQSLDQVKSKQQTTKTDLGQLSVTPQGKGVVIPKGGIMTSADPADLADRWGVTSKSIASTDENLRGMSPKQSEAYINKLVDSYKNGTPVSPVLETRDADNNIVDVDGRHRALAAQRAGVKRIPIVIRRLDVTASSPEDLTARPE